MPTCKQMTEMASDRAEGNLGFLERLRFDRHLAHCEGCRAYVRQLAATTRALRRLPGPENLTRAERRADGPVRRVGSGEAGGAGSGGGTAASEAARAAGSLARAR